MRQSITRAIADCGRTVRLPVHVSEDMTKILRAEKFLKQKLGCIPSAEDIAETTGLSIERVTELHLLGISTVSLESPTRDDGEGTLADCVPDVNSITPVTAAMETALGEAIQMALETLPEREAEVIRLRFGLVDGRQHTLEEVGRVFHITRERARQVEEKALRHLRHPSRAQLLREYSASA